MVDAVINREKWAPLQTVSSPKSWGKRPKDYLVVSSGMTESDDNGNTFSDELALADGFISELNRLYEFRGGLVLEDFLRGNTHLGNLLLEAYEVIREHFGPRTRVALEVITDSEAPGDQELFVVIRTRFRPKLARALLSDLDRGWWRDALPIAKGKMELALE